MKKLFSIVIVAALVCLCAVACDKKTDDDKTNASGSGASYAVSDFSAVSSAEGEDPISEGTDASQSAAQTESENASYSAFESTAQSESDNGSYSVPQSATQSESDNASYSAPQSAAQSESDSASVSADIPTSEQEEASASEQDASDSEDSAIWGPPISDGGGFSFNFN